MTVSVFNPDTEEFADVSTKPVALHVSEAWLDDNGQRGSEMVWAAVPKLENGSWGKHAVPTSRTTSASLADRERCA